MVQFLRGEDALVGSSHPKIIGTGSARRQSQLSLFFDENVLIKGIRGNVDTRLHKLDHENYDAIVLAMAGLKRLGISRNDIQPLAFLKMVPAAGQGALGIQARRNDHEVLSALSSINDATTQICVEAERRLLEALGGGCHAPIGCHIHKINCDMFQGFYFDGKKIHVHQAPLPDEIISHWLAN